ncbi:MAG: hypothetical protein AAGE80_05315 [Pseudomonadota bacterium]
MPVLRSSLKRRARRIEMVQKSVATPPATSAIKPGTCPSSSVSALRQIKKKGVVKIVRKSAHTPQRPIISLKNERDGYDI